MRIKYKMEPIDSGFVPFTVKFFIDTQEKAEWFHDNVAIKVSNDRTFIGNMFEGFAPVIDTKIGEFTVEKEKREIL